MKVRGPGDYKKHDPIGWCGDRQRGAALGRSSYHAEDPSTWEGKLYVSRVALDDGGYDVNGTYFGHGDPLYWVRDAECEIDYMLRAPNRVTAIGDVLETYPKAKFTMQRADREWLKTTMGV